MAERLSPITLERATTLLRTMNRSAIAIRTLDELAEFTTLGDDYDRAMAEFVSLTRRS
jgi:hypothetical protein